MFTGVVQELGTVETVERSDAGARLRVTAALASEVRRGESVAVDGACLTVADCEPGAFETDVMNQTLSLTTLGGLGAGAEVNLERALRAGEPLGGHIVQGHVDAVGEVASVAQDGIATRLRVTLPNGLERYAVEHGSITLAGVSLTVAALDRELAEVSLIPETLQRTVLGRATTGSKLNIEIDVIARYVERLLGFDQKGSR